jgi:MYXO-CTERM domain-containing protein
VFKSFSAAALLFAAAIGAQAQTSPGEASRAALDNDRGRLGPAASIRDPKAASCGGAGQVACAKSADGQTAERVTAGEPDALALAWAALGVVAFVALRRRPR